MKKQPFDFEHNDLAGHASVDFVSKIDFASFAEKLTGYNSQRFSPVALRLFVQKGQPMLTLYALDNSKGEEKGKLPVKKFKLKLEMEELFAMIKKFDFTVSDGKYEIRDLVVINK